MVFKFIPFDQFYAIFSLQDCPVIVRYMYLVKFPPPLIATTYRLISKIFPHKIIKLILSYMLHLNKEFIVVMKVVRDFFKATGLLKVISGYNGASPKKYGSTFCIWT